MKKKTTKTTKKTTKAKSKTPAKKKGKELVVASAEVCFWVNNGPVLKDLKELSAALKDISPEQYGYHVEKGRNDFASWVNDILQDAACAKSLRAAKSQNAAHKAVVKRLASYR